MPSAVECRERAAELRRQSESTTLPNVRRQHQQAAEKWEIIADEIEHCSLRLVRANGWESLLFH